MKDIIKSLSSSDSEIEDIFFNRPVNRSFSGSIGLVLSSNIGLVTVNKIYTALLAMQQPVIIVADEKLSGGVLPVDVNLKSKDKIRYANTDEGLDALTGCKLIVVLAGREMNSAMELFVNKLCLSYSGTVITDYPKMFDKTKFVGQKLLMIDSKIIHTDKSAGINKLFSLLQQYSKKTDSATTYFSSKQVLGADWKINESLCVINSSEEVNKYEFIGILASLLIDKKNPLDQEWLRYCRAAGFLYRIYQKDGLEGVKKYLNDKF
jgi:hypothetical protein